VKGETLLSSDRGIRQERPHSTRRFVEFLEHRAAGAERLYMLGNLFNVWFGDDDPIPPNQQISPPSSSEPPAARVMAVILRELEMGGVLRVRSWLFWATQGILFAFLLPTAKRRRRVMCSQP
jgi:hypothetical protein